MKVRIGTEFLVYSRLFRIDLQHVMCVYAFSVISFEYTIVNKK